MITALVSGSFDPITKGHIPSIKAGLKVADRLIIAVAVNSGKQGHLDYRARLRLINEALAEELTADEHLRVSVKDIGNVMIVDFCDQVEATIIVRGLRNTDDFVYEKNLDQFNSDMAPHITTVYVMAPPELQAVSSSAVKSMIGFKNWEERIAKYVHTGTLATLKHKYDFEYGRTKVVA